LSFPGFSGPGFPPPGGKGQAVPPDLQEPGIFHAEEPQRAVLRVNPELPDDVCAAGERSEQGKLLMIFCVEFPGSAPERLGSPDPDDDYLPVRCDNERSRRLSGLHEFQIVFIQSLSAQVFHVTKAGESVSLG